MMSLGLALLIIIFFVVVVINPARVISNFCICVLISLINLLLSLNTFTVPFFILLSSNLDLFTPALFLHSFIFHFAFFPVLQF